MKKKFTLSIDERLKKRAKRIARKEGRSVSDMVEEFIEKYPEPESDWEPPEGSITAELMEIIPEKEKLDDPDYEKLKSEALGEKYGDS